MLNILLFTDSRGEHKHHNFGGKIYHEKLKDMGYNMKIVLCPCKWTTTLDFFEYIEINNIIINNYDLIILHTGIVEFSPRQTNNMYLLYNNPSNESLKEPRKVKVQNQKKNICDKIFGQDKMKEHLDRKYETKYLGDHTNNLYSLDMLKDNMIPELKKIKNLLWISCNNICPGWNGNYFRERPSNITMIEDYSKLVVEMLPSENVIDLHVWTNDQVKIFTCDNMHLTLSGSDYIFNKIIENIKKRFNLS